MHKRLAFHENLGMRLRGAYLSLHRRTNAHFAQFGVTSDQFVVLGLLMEEDGITQQQLSGRSFSDPNTIAAMLNVLERKGFVCRKAHATDRRVRLVMLTSEGRSMAKRLTRSLDRFHTEFRATLPEDEPEVVYEWLARVIDVMQPPQIQKANRQS